jgi:hypothetical protein
MRNMKRYCRTSYGPERLNLGPKSASLLKITINCTRLKYAAKKIQRLIS